MLNYVFCPEKWMCLKTIQLLPMDLVHPFSVGPKGLKSGQVEYLKTIYYFTARTTFFGSTVPLNRTQILTSVYPKTLAQFQEVAAHEQSVRSLRKGTWPEYSEYTSKYLLRTPSEIKRNP